MTLVKTKSALPSGTASVFEYIGKQADRLEQLGRVRTGETYRQTLNSFRKYRRQVDISFSRLDADVIEQYESYMKGNGLSRNTTSFYMRILRSLCNRAAEEGLVVPGDPFKRVYTGVDKTTKRAITMKEIKRIKALNLTACPDLDYARDIFLLSFYLRGMSFIDMSYLCKKDLSNGYIAYTRKKTGQQLIVKWEQPMQDILDKYGENPTRYLLPIIVQKETSERRQYLNRLLYINRKLKKIALRAGIATPLNMYVSRHSWASIARSKNIPLSIISEGMGHDNEKTTRIYLAGIQSNKIDKANRLILKDL